MNNFKDLYKGVEFFFKKNLCDFFLSHVLRSALTIRNQILLLALVASITLMAFKVSSNKKEIAIEKASYVCYDITQQKGAKIFKTVFIFIIFKNKAAKEAVQQTVTLEAETKDTKKEIEEPKMASKLDAVLNKYSI